MRRNRNGHKIDYGHKTFEEMIDDLDANIKRIKAEIKCEEEAFVELE